jgi:hypothetical protein
MATVRPCPAYVLSRPSDVLAANPEGLALLSSPARNGFLYVFRHPAARSLFAQWDRVARDCVAHLRTVAAADPESTELADLVGELSAASTDFARLWQHYEVRAKSGTDKQFHHPSVGRFRLTSEVLHLAGGDQRLVVYQAAPGSRDADALALLALAATG